MVDIILMIMMLAEVGSYLWLVEEGKEEGAGGLCVCVCVYVCIY